MSMMTHIAGAVSMMRAGAPASGSCLFGSTVTAPTTYADTVWKDGYYDVEGFEVVCGFDNAASGTLDYIGRHDASNFYVLVPGTRFRVKIAGVNYDMNGVSSWNLSLVTQMTLSVEFGVTATLTSDNGDSDSVSLVGSGDYSGLSGDLFVGDSDGVGSDQWAFGDIGCFKKL